MFNFKRYLYDINEDSIINFYLGKPNVKISDIAKHFSISEGELYRRLHSNKIFPNRLKKNHENVLKMSKLGWNINEISKYTGYTTRNIRYILQQEKNDNIF